jgi:hypothetical protein
MEGQPFGHEGIVAAPDERDQARFERTAALAGWGTSRRHHREYHHFSLKLPSQY